MPIVQQHEHVRCQEQCNEKGGKRDNVDIFCLPAPCLPSAILSLYCTCPLFPYKGIRNLLGTRGNRQTQSITDTSGCNLCLVPEAPTWDRGQGSQPQHLPCSMGPGTASQDRWHKSTRGLQVSPRSASYRTSNWGNAHGCSWHTPYLGEEGVAVRNEKQGPGRCPALF